MGLILILGIAYVVTLVFGILFAVDSFKQKGQEQRRSRVYAIISFAIAAIVSLFIF